MPFTQPSNYLILGDEDFLKEEAIKEIISRFLEPQTKDLNYNVFFAKDKDFNIKILLETLNTVPFMARKRIILLKEAEGLDETAKGLLLSYLKDPNPTTVFIIESGASRIQDEFLLNASKMAHLIIRRRLMDREIDLWLIKKAGLAHKRFQRDAIRVIKENLPYDMGIISSYIDNLILYTGKRPLITREDVENMIGAISLDTGLDILKAIEKNDVRKALWIYAQISKGRRRETEFLGLLGWYLRILFRIKELIKIKNKFEIRKELGLYSMKLDQAFNLASRFSRRKIRILLKEVLKADIDIKSGLDLPRLIIERFIVKMCS